MKILSIYIENYGAVKNKKLELSSGLNLITGENESGKSTVCAFIKFIFYGHADSKERELRASLESGISAGHLTFLHSDEKIYRIERRESEARSKPKIFCETDECELKKISVSPGEYFLGIPEKLYARSLFISQLSSPELDRQSSEAVANLLTSGSESVNIKRAKSSLDDMRKELRHLKGNGGRISELDAEINAVHERLVQAIERQNRLSVLLEEKKGLDEKCDKLKAEIDGARATERSTRLTGTAKLISEIEKLDNEITEITDRQKKHRESNTYKGFLPSTDYLSKLKEASLKVEIAKKSVEGYEILPKTPPVPPKGYDFCQRNDPKTFKAKLSTANSLKKKFIFAAIPTLATGITFLILSQISTAFLAFGFVILAFGVALTVMAAKKSKYLKDIFSSMGIKSLNELPELYNRSENYKTELENFIFQAAGAEQTKNDFIAKSSELANIFTIWGKTSAEDAENDFISYMEIDSLLDQNRTELCEKKKELSILLSTSPESETAEAKKLLETHPEIIKSDTSNNISSSELAAKAEKLKETEAVLHEKNVEIARTEGEGYEEAAEIAVLEHELLLKKEACKKQFDAVMLAIDAITEAEKSVRRTFIPQISKLGGEYFSELTEKRYSSLSLDSDFELSTRESETEYSKRSEYFSGGSLALAWLCLRLALCSRISDAPLPLIFDEPFVYYDENRLKLAIKLLEKLAKDGTQILLFSASDREKRVSTSAVNLKL